MITPIALRAGSSVLVKGKDGTEELLKVVRRKSGGYLLRVGDDADPRHVTDGEILAAHIERRLRIFPCNVRNLPAPLAEALDKTWEFWPEDLRREATRRLIFCKRARDMRAAHATLLGACRAASGEVWAENVETWAEEDREAHARNQAEAGTRRRRKPVDPDRVAPAPEPRAKPNEHTVANWFRRWTTAGENLKALIPLTHGRGNRKPRYARGSHGDDDTYALMRRVVNEDWLSIPRKAKRTCFATYKALCQSKGVTAVSENTFRSFIDATVTDYEEFAGRHGSRAAYLRFGIFDRRKPPERALQEVEVDHCLIDIIAVSRDGRRLGRPWLTVFLDRATRMIVGAHLSFESPSYASLQRAMMHAFWPKDLRGINGIVNDWPCFGVPEMIFCDNGREFHSRSLKAAEAALDFNLVYLPVKSPWLKGAVERLFRTIGGQVFSMEEGSTLSKTKDVYDPLRRATLSLGEISAKFLKWVVDDYHQTKHLGIGCPPIERWHELTQAYPVRPVPDFEHIIPLTGQVAEKTIQNVGVSVEGLLYADKRELEALLRRRGAIGRLWQIRVDPYELGEVYLLDDQEGRWIVLPCVDQRYARGLSTARHHMHVATAKANLPAGTLITVDHLVEAKGLCEAEVALIQSRKDEMRTAARAARYACRGELLTPIASELPSILGHSPIAVPQVAAPNSAAAPDPDLVAAARSAIPDLSALIAANAAARKLILDRDHNRGDA